MDLPLLDHVDFIPIPPLFHSVQHGRPFERCIDCNEELLIDGVGYVIEKCFRRGDVIFEYALCLDCHECIADDISKESRRRIDAHIGERIDHVARRNELIERAPTDVDAWLDRCLLTKKPIDQCAEYRLIAECDGPDLMFAYMPFMLSGDAMEDLMRLLSKTTKDTLEDFTGRCLGMPPEFMTPSDQPRLPMI